MNRSTLNNARKRIQKVGFVVRYDIPEPARWFVCRESGDIRGRKALDRYACGWLWGRGELIEHSIIGNGTIYVYRMGKS